MGRFYPKYHIHLSNGFKYLMSAKKRACNNTSNYLVSMNRNDLNRKSFNFLGKVRSNFMGTEFTLYDHGEDPKKVKNKDLARSELGMVFYESNLLGTKGPRKMQVSYIYFNNIHKIRSYCQKFMIRIVSLINLNLRIQKKAFYRSSSKERFRIQTCISIDLRNGMNRFKRLC